MRRSPVPSLSLQQGFPASRNDCMRACHTFAVIVAKLQKSLTNPDYNSRDYLYVLVYRMGNQAQHH